MNGVVDISCRVTEREAPWMPSSQLHSFTESDNLRWPCVAALVRDDTSCGLLMQIFNARIELRHWPIQFKEAVGVVITKPKKEEYSRLKAYRPMVLLTCLGKLCENILSAPKHYKRQNRGGDFHPCQFGDTKHHSTTDARMMLVHRIRQGCAWGLDTSVLASNVAQFYPSVNY